MQQKINPITLEVIKNGFDTVADEMALIVMRSAYSGVVRDAMDYSTAVCDAQGQTVAQGLTTPLHLGSFFDAMRCLIEQYEGRIYPEDIFIFNDPYSAGGQHLPDIYIIKPVFFEDALCGFATTLAHHTDVGGIVPGSNALGSTEIFQEGLCLPILKLYERGEPNETIWAIIERNVRVPDMVLGDLRAQISAAHVGAREFAHLFRRYGSETMGVYIEAIHDYAERLTRAEIAEMPDGIYKFSNHIDGLGEDPVPIEFHVKLTVQGDEMIVDWTGTSDQVKAGINAPIPFTRAAAYAAIRSVLPAEVPNSQGVTRAITVVAPEGSIANPVHPGPCGARGITGFRMIDCLFGALAQVRPDRVTADGCGGATIPAFGGRVDGKPFVFVETLMGNWGGAPTHDGQEGVPHIGANQSNIPVEMIEATYPLRVEQYGFVADSGGPGTFRGGLSIVRDIRALADDIVLTVRSDKRRFRPYGLKGGEPGASSWNIINPDEEHRELPVLLTKPEILNDGDVFRHIMAGGGGYGEPLERDPEHVLKDVIAEKVTIAHARQAYSVVIVDKPDAHVDVEATAKLRADAADRRIMNRE
jgi:N-methylhydantoinase B